MWLQVRERTLEMFSWDNWRLDRRVADSRQGLCGTEWCTIARESDGEGRYTDSQAEGYVGKSELENGKITREAGTVAGRV